MVVPGFGAGISLTSRFTLGITCTEDFVFPAPAAGFADVLAAVGSTALAGRAPPLFLATGAFATAALTGVDLRAGAFFTADVFFECCLDAAAFAAGCFLVTAPLLTALAVPFPEPFTAVFFVAAFPATLFLAAGFTAAIFFAAVLTFRVPDVLLVAALAGAAVAAFRAGAFFAAVLVAGALPDGCFPAAAFFTVALFVAGLLVAGVLLAAGFLEAPAFFAVDFLFFPVAILNNSLNIGCSLQGSAPTASGGGGASLRLVRECQRPRNQAPDDTPSRGRLSPWPGRGAL